MQSLQFNRSITRELSTAIGQRGVREGDDMQIDIFQERKKSFRLNRTKYTITAGKTFSFNTIDTLFTLPCTQIYGASFEMLLVNELNRNFNEHSRYLLRSLSNEPFRLNGTYCYEAFLERGDIVDIGYNRFHFQSPKSQLKLVSDQDYLSDDVVKSALSILLEGETGTGKTTLARQIHEASGRAGRFVHLNLSAFAPGLIESELFGHVKGAFTGALNPKRGAILEAHKGTLFLDEIDSLTLDLQTKLLLFLDDYCVRPVGGETTSKVDVRLIFASGSRLRERVEMGRLRKDFFYRLQGGCSFQLPSLRDQPDKIRSLIQQFEFKHAVVFSDEAISFYQRCLWPGNIRQLISHLQKKKIYSGGKKIVLDHHDEQLLTEECSVQNLNGSEILTLERIKMDYCYNAWLKIEKNIGKTARILEVSPNTLKAYLQKKQSEMSGADLRDDKVIDIDI